MDHLAEFQRYAALVRKMREAQNWYDGKKNIFADKSSYAYQQKTKMQQAVDTYPLPWEKGEGK